MLLLFVLSFHWQVNAKLKLAVWRHNGRKCSSTSVKLFLYFPFRTCCKPAVLTSRGQARTTLRVLGAHGHEPRRPPPHRAEPGAKQPGSESIHMEGVSVAAGSVCVLFLKTRSSADK